MVRQYAGNPRDTRRHLYVYVRRTRDVHVAWNGHLLTRILTGIIVSMAIHIVTLAVHKFICFFAQIQTAIEKMYIKLNSKVNRNAIDEPVQAMAGTETFFSRQICNWKWHFYSFELNCLSKRIRNEKLLVLSFKFLARCYLFDSLLENVTRWEMKHLFVMDWLQANSHWMWLSSSKIHLLLTSPLQMRTHSPLERTQ